MRLAIAAAALAAAAAAHAQPPAAKDLFKGKVREGLYEMRNEADLTGVPGIPKEQAKSSDTRKRCLAAADIERGLSLGKDCKLTAYKASGKEAHVVTECRDGARTEMRYTFAADGFSSETRTTGVEAGKPFTALYKAQSRYLGPCPSK